MPITINRVDAARARELTKEFNQSDMVAQVLNSLYDQIRQKALCGHAVHGMSWKDEIPGLVREAVMQDIRNSGYWVEEINRILWIYWEAKKCPS